MLEQFSTLMKEELEEIGITLNEEQMNQFYRYYELLEEWNKVMNLTTITELEDVVTKHFTDSLSLVKAIPNLGEEPISILDMGTGAGFPGIPLKIVFPKLKITLLDSLNKKINFLNHVIEELKLEDIDAIHGRAEDFGRDKDHRERYDYCVSRAVANLTTLSEYCLPYVKIGGAFIPYKSGKIEEELSQAKGAVKLLGGKVEEVVAFLLPKTEVERTFVVIRKKEGTSKKYPRKAGLPGKEPIRI